MLAYALKRLLLACLVVLTVSGITFIMTNAAIDPAKAIAGANATTEDIEALRRSFGFDRPWSFSTWTGWATP